MLQPIQLPNGSTIVLRPVSEDQVDRLYDAVYSSRYELIPWSPWCHENYSLEETETWVRDTLAAEGEHAFAIFDESENLCLGTCGLNNLKPRVRSINLGYWIRSSHIKQGIATAAALQVAKFAFTELNLARVEIAAAVGNLASQRVAEKVGATREGILRNGLIKDDEPIDSVLFSLIPADFD